MRYMLLIYTKETAVAKHTPEEAKKIAAAHWAVMDETSRQGIFRGAEPLHPTSTATTIRVQNGKVLSTDGPFAETKEQPQPNVIGHQSSVIGSEILLKNKILRISCRSLPQPSGSTVVSDPLAARRIVAQGVRGCEKINLIVGAALRGRPDPRPFIWKAGDHTGSPVQQQKKFPARCRFCSAYPSFW